MSFINDKNHLRKEISLIYDFPCGHFSGRPSEMVLGRLRLGAIDTRLDSLALMIPQHTFWLLRVSVSCSFGLFSTV